MLGIGGGVILLLIIALGYVLIIQPKQEAKRLQEEKIRNEQAMKELEAQIVAHLADADLNMNLRNYSKAQTAYQKALSLDQNNEKAKEGLVQATKFEGIFKLVQQGDDLQKSKNYDEAVQIYESALEKDPENAIIQDKIKESEERKVAYIEMKARVDKILEQGKSHYDEGDYNQAIQLYRKALKIIPDDVDSKTLIKAAEFEKRRGVKVQANLKLGLSRYESRKYDQARKYFEEVLKLDPDNRDAKFYMNKIEEEQKIY